MNAIKFEYFKKTIYANQFNEGFNKKRKISR